MNAPSVFSSFIFHISYFLIMQSKATTVEQYLAELPEDRKEAMTKLRLLINENIPDGFEERMSYGMIGWVVPHSLYPDGYHCDPKLPLAFMSLGSQKNYIVLHHMGLYGDKNLLDWFTKEYVVHSKSKLDMGKGCVRFKKPEQIPYTFIGELVRKISVEDWVITYETAFKK